jgi:putative mRNA 3-end processing factor
MLSFTNKGIYCAQADVYIDPWQPVDRAIITHAHSDHARPGNKHYLCQELSRSVLRWRLGADIDVETLPYEQAVYINGVEISLHPAGHVIGSAQVRLAYKGEVWVVSGDYKLQDDGLSTAFEPVPCQHFVSECTFGLPIYKFPSAAENYAEINEWWRSNAAEGFNTVLLGYALGKAQRILQHLDTSIGPVFLHGAVHNVNEALAAEGFQFPGIRLTPETNKAELKGAMIVAPPSALGTPWLKRMTPYRVGYCSGWMQLRGARRRYGVDRGFIMSDHCDWEQLNTAITATGAEHIYVTHGYEAVFGRWLREERGLDAHEVKTMFATTEEDV